MQHAATTWTFASADNRLAELMKTFGCADMIAPVDAEAFGKRAGELLTRVVFSKRAEWLARSKRGAAMETSRQFQEYADECERLAEQATSEDQRRTLRKIAVAWRRVAEEREQRVS